MMLMRYSDMHIMQLEKGLHGWKAFRSMLPKRAYRKSILTS